MANPQNIEPYKMKKGTTLNPNGRPRKTINQVNIDLEKQGVVEATKNDILSCYLRLINLSTEEITKLVNDKQQPALIQVVGKAILSGKGFDVIELMLDRAIGKATQKTEHSGEVAVKQITPIKFKDE